ncbi:MAG: hypothetical protein AAF404_15610, partial [Pseudomonadota bacterium]
ESVAFDKAYGRYRLQGTLNELHSGGLFNWRFARLRPKDLITSWIRHLLLCDLKPVDSQYTSVLVCEDWTIEFRPVMQAAELLQQLLDIRHTGLMHPPSWLIESAFRDFLNQDPPPPDSSGAAIKIKRQEDIDRELAQATQIVWRGLTPDANDIHELSTQVFGPLFDHAAMTSASADSAS